MAAQQLPRYGGGLAVDKRRTHLNERMFFLSPCFGRLCLHVAVTLAWLLHHFPSSKFLDCPFSSLWTILTIDIKGPARSDDVRVMLDWASVHWALAAVCWALSFSSCFSPLLSPCDTRYPSQLIKVLLIGRHWSVYVPGVFTHLQCGLEPRNLDGARQLLVPSARQMNRPKSSLTSMCMEVTYMCRLLGLFLSCFGLVCLYVAVTLAWLLQLQRHVLLY